MNSMNIMSLGSNELIIPHGNVSTLLTTQPLTEFHFSSGASLSHLLDQPLIFLWGLLMLCLTHISNKSARFSCLIKQAERIKQTQLIGYGVLISVIDPFSTRAF